MKFIGFTHELAYPRHDHNVYVNVRLPKAKTPTVLRLLLDTGAAITILNRRYAKHLGIDDIRAGEEFAFVDVTGHKGLAYVHPVQIEFLGRAMQVDIAFAPEVDTADLLGMRGFFDQMKVAFDHRDRKVHFVFD